MKHLSRTTKIALFLLLVAAVMLAMTPMLARAQDGGAPTVMSEAEFIALAGAEKPGDATGGEQGQPMKDATGEPAKKEEEDDSDSEEEPASDGEGSDDDEDAGDDTDDDDEEQPGDDTEDSKAPPKGKTKKSATNEDDEPSEESEEDAEFDAEFQAALEAEGANPSLKDIPEAARPIVAKKLRDLEAGFTRATQRLAAERTAAVTFRAEERFRKEKPANFIVAMLLEHPELSEQVNEIVNELDGNKTAVAGHAALVENARRDAAKAETADGDKRIQHEQKIERFIQLGRAASRAAGVPFAAGVEEGIAAHLSIYGDISEAEIRGIARAKAKVFKDATRGRRREESREYTKAKVGDRQRAPLKIRPGSGSAPAPGARKVAKNDQDFIEEFSSRAG
jgi:hypothetical protein